MAEEVELGEQGSGVDKQLHLIEELGLGLDGDAAHIVAGRSKARSAVLRGPLELRAAVTVAGGVANPVGGHRALQGSMATMAASSSGIQAPQSSGTMTVRRPSGS